MKRRSEETRALIGLLQGPLPLHEKTTRDYESIFAEIAELGDPAAIVDVLPFALASNSTVANAAAAAVHRLLLVTPLMDLVWIDSDLRKYSYYPFVTSLEWYNLSPSQLGLLERFAEASTSLLALATSHRNGYVREKALRKLSLVTTGVEVPFLILRLNDWVPNVRELANTAIRSRLRPEYSTKLIANLELLSHLEHARRADHSEITDAINQLLQSDECRTELLASLNSKDRFVRRACFKLVLASTTSDLQQQVVTQALNTNDTNVRRLAAETVRTAFTGATLERFLERIKRDPFMPVRREALRTAVELKLPQVTEALREALLDPTQSIREESRHHFRKIEAMDFGAFYRQHLTTAKPQMLFAAISGLGETGRPPDDTLLLPFCTHSASSIRRAAIKALAALKPEAHLETFLSALEDEAGGVSRLGAKVLARRTSSISAARLWDLFVSTPHLHVKRNVLSLMAKFTKWESISYLVRAHCEDDEEIVTMSKFAVNRWLFYFNRSFSAPSSEQVARLREALEQCGKFVDEKAVQLLRFSMPGH